MFFKPKEHEPAHIHAIYNEYVGIFDIKTFEMTEGDLPQKAQQLVKGLTTEIGLWSLAQLDSSKTCISWNEQIDLPSDTIYEYGMPVN